MHAFFVWFNVVKILRGLRKQSLKKQSGNEFLGCFCYPLMMSAANKLMRLHQEEGYPQNDVHYQQEQSLIPVR